MQSKQVAYCVSAAPDISELEKDPDLALKTDEPEAWSVTMEKKVLKKMSKKEIKRQDNIFGETVGPWIRRLIFVF